MSIMKEKKSIEKLLGDAIPNKYKADKQLRKKELKTKNLF